MRRGQFTVEFVVIFSVAFIIFLIIVVLVTKFVDDSRSIAEQRKLTLFAESVQKDLVLASEAGSDFEAQLTLPNTVDGIGYDITIDARMLRINSSNRFVVYKNIPNVTAGTFIKPGCNEIKKEGGKISIVQPCT